MTLNAMPDDSQLALPPLDEKVDHVRGGPGRLILEYGDYECPYSRQADDVQHGCWVQEAIVKRWQVNPHHQNQVRRRGRPR